MAANLVLHFLGHPQLFLQGLPVAVTRRAVMALVAYLAVDNQSLGRQKHTRESLSALLWPDYDQVKAFTNLRHTLWEIQKVFGPGWLTADRETVSLHPEADLWVDVHRFESLLQESRSQEDISRRIPLLTECVRLYRHHFLTGFSLKNAPTFDEWSLSKAEELRYQFSEALTLLTEDYCLLGDAPSALPYARRLVMLDPLNESAHRLLMQVYAQTGQHTAALKQYQMFEQTLRREVGLDPQPETRALYRQIRKGEVSSSPVEQKKQPVTPKNYLPQQLTSFIGREEEQAELIRLIASNRLVTLIGAGGVGKTRLSLEVARKALAQFPDGAWFVELAPLSDPDLIPQAILSVLGFGEQAGKSPLQVLEEQLVHKKALLILDNCEHLVDASARVAHALLTSAPETKILATSREALGVAGELAWGVPSLAVPDVRALPQIEQLTQYESVRLFLERAFLVQPYFRVDPDNVRSVAQICSRLDGIPLAIELAAARVKALGVEQIARRLDDRFRLLTGGSRTGIERHQTLRAAIDWSYNLLTDEEKKLLRRLSVFAGGWTLEAAEQVCVRNEGEIDVLEILSRLVDKSLVVTEGITDHLSATGALRYRLLESTRQYGREKLFASMEGEKFHDQHLAYFVRLAEEGHKEITGPRQAEVIDRLDAELDNFRLALDWCVSHRRIEPALQMLGCLGWAWDMRGYYHEVRSWFDKIRLRGECADYPEVYARLLNHLGRFAADFDNLPEAGSILEEARAIWLRLGSRGERGLADVLCFLGMNAFINETNIDKAESFFEQSLELARKCNNERVIAASMRFLGDVELERGNLPEALRLYENSLKYSEQIGDLLIISIAAGQLGGVLVESGNYEKARPLIDRQLGVNENLKFRLGLADAWINRGDLYRYQGNSDQAEQCFEKSLSVSRDLGLNGHVCFNLFLLSMLALQRDNYSVALQRFREYFDFARRIQGNVCLFRFLMGMSAVAGGSGQTERCARLFGAAQSIYEANKIHLPEFDRREFDRHFQIARAQVGDPTFDRLSQEGRTMTIEQAIHLAREMTG